MFDCFQAGIKLLGQRASDSSSISICLTSAMFERETTTYATHGFQESLSFSNEGQVQKYILSRASGFELLIMSGQQAEQLRMH